MPKYRIEYHISYHHGNGWSMVERRMISKNIKAETVDDAVNSFRRSRNRAKSSTDLSKIFEDETVIFVKKFGWLDRLPSESEYPIWDDHDSVVTYTKLNDGGFFYDGCMYVLENPDDGHTKIALIPARIVYNLYRDDYVNMTSSNTSSYTWFSFKEAK